MVGGAEDPRRLRLCLDAVDVGDQIEPLLRLGVLTLFEDLPPRVREAAGTDAPARLRHGVVSVTRSRTAS